MVMIKKQDEFLDMYEKEVVQHPKWEGLELYHQKRPEGEGGLSRRSFLKYGLAVAGIGAIGSVITMEPVPYKRGTAWAESKIPAEYWEIASRYGPPQGKFGVPGGPATITVGYQPYCLQCMTANINKMARLWEKYLPKGSQVKWFRSLSGPLINNNMLAGKNQFGYMCDTPGLRNLDTVPAKGGCTGGYDPGEHGAVVVRKDLYDAGKIRTVKDLDGKKIGVPFGSFSHRQAYDVVHQFKVRPKLLDQSTELQVTHMRAKNIDACITWEPYPSYLEYLGSGVRLLTGLEMDCTCISYRPQNAYHFWTTSDITLMVVDWLRDRPDIMVAYLKAEEEARDMWANNLELSAYYVWTDIPEFPQPVIRMVMEMNTPDGRFIHAPTAPDGKRGLADHQKGIAMQWREAGYLTTEKSKDPEKFVDNEIDDRFYRLALKELEAEGRWTSNRLAGFPVPIRADMWKRRHNLKNYMDVKLKPREWKPTKVKL